MSTGERAAKYQFLWWNYIFAGCRIRNLQFGRIYARELCERRSIWRRDSAGVRP